MDVPSRRPGAGVLMLLAAPILWLALGLPAAAAPLATWQSLAPSMEPYDNPFAEMSAIGVAAILGRNWTEARVAGTPERRICFEAGARIAGAACVLVIGTTLFAVTFAQTPATESRQQAAVAPLAQTVTTAIAN